MPRRPIYFAALLMSTLPFASLVYAQLPPGTQDAADAPHQSADDAHVRAAEAALERGDSKSAQAQLETLAAEHPVNAQVQYDLGYAAEQNNDSATARKAYGAATIADPAFADAWVALGLLQAREGHGDDGAASLRKGAALSSGAPEVRARAFRALAVLDEATQPDEAHEELASAIQLTGETPADILMGAEMARQAGDLPDAETAYQRAATHPEVAAAASAGLAEVLRAEKKYPEARTVLLAALRSHPDDAQLNLQLALVDSGLGDPKAGAALLNKLRSSNAAMAADTELTRAAARMSAEAGDLTGAAPLYEYLLQHAPGDALLLDEYGSLLVKSQRYTEAQEVLAKAFAARSAFPSASDWAECAGHLAFAASKNHQPQVALQALAARATVLPNTPASLFLEATAYDTLHQYKQAEQSYRAFLAIADGNYSNESFEARHRIIALENMK